jgi:hypothetical protein
MSGLFKYTQGYFSDVYKVDVIKTQLDRDPLPVITLNDVINMVASLTFDIYKVEAISAYNEHLTFPPHAIFLLAGLISADIHKVDVINICYKPEIKFDLVCRTLALISTDSYKLKAMKILVAGFTSVKQCPAERIIKIFNNDKYRKEAIKLLISEGLIDNSANFDNLFCTNAQELSKIKPKI